MKYQKPQSFIKADKIPIIDVRSPLEYQKGHIPLAINIPLFTNEERHEIGIIYKKLGKLQAIEKGLGFVGPKMMEIAQKARDISEHNERKVYCWRGGMRSEKMAWLFELIGMQCQVLEGGYKAYRNCQSADFSKIENLIILHGSTGCGKTEILKELSLKGEQVIDLEKLANHRGSAFGFIGNKNKQPTSQQFQNDIHNTLTNLDFSKRIWIEGESMKIGLATLPEALWLRMKKAHVIEIRVERTKRVKRIVKEYGLYPKPELMDSILKINSQFGKQNTQDAVHFLEMGQLEETANLLLKYYDHSYEYTRKRFREQSIFVVKSESGDSKENSDKLLTTLTKYMNLEVA
ncbi:MAG: tRNA 2-selenouridine(34) synthase MnmH [Calditrichaeota bacterium]|nr:MAG: tRNA 2-selenouridine(34) synthase MnmH [Calditrichota bacterium]MBL1203841.1 tRNA 2-selenouridine(34) synthase MnmH [Calditrichota bacterium]NOG43673.1 tRNA 2-selenouridine(34) synthase MnmH [Calditrichota bacterium]